MQRLTRTEEELRQQEIEQTRYEDVAVRDAIANGVREAIITRQPPPPGLDPMQTVHNQRAANLQEGLNEEVDNHMVGNAFWTAVDAFTNLPRNVQMVRNSQMATIGQPIPEVSAPFVDSEIRYTRNPAFSPVIMGVPTFGPVMESSDDDTPNPHPSDRYTRNPEFGPTILEINVPFVDSESSDDDDDDMPNLHSSDEEALPPASEQLGRNDGSTLHYTEIDVSRLTTAEGFHQALQTMQDDLAKGQFVNPGPSQPPIDFYIDPETGEAHRRLPDGTWINETRRFRGAPGIPTPQFTDSETQEMMRRFGGEPETPAPRIAAPTQFNDLDILSVMQQGCVSRENAIQVLIRNQGRVDLAAIELLQATPQDYFRIAYGTVRVRVDATDFEIEEALQHTRGNIAAAIEFISEYDITDVNLIISQTGVSREVARMSLRIHNGDIVNAIMDLIPVHYRVSTNPDSQTGFGYRRDERRETTIHDPRTGFGYRRNERGQYTPFRPDPEKLNSNFGTAARAPPNPNIMTRELSPPLIPVTNPGRVPVTPIIPTRVPMTTTAPNGPMTTTAPNGPTPTTAPNGPMTTTAPNGPTPTTAPNGPTPTTAPRIPMIPVTTRATEPAPTTAPRIPMIPVTIRATEPTPITVPRIPMPTVPKIPMTTAPNGPTTSTAPNGPATSTALNIPMDTRPPEAMEPTPRFFTPPVNDLVPGLPNGRVPATPIFPENIPGIPRLPEGMQLPRVPPIPRNTQVPVVPRYTGGIPQVRLPTVQSDPPKAPEAQIPLPTENPYLRLPRGILDNIATDRDIQIMGDSVERARQLFEYDQIMPDWLQSILGLNIETFQVLTGVKIYVFGALNGVDYNDVVGIPNRDLLNYTRISILLNNPTHPGRRILPGLLQKLNRDMLERFVRRLGVSPNQIRFIREADLHAMIIANQVTINLEQISQYAQRYELLTRHKYSNMLDALYNINGNDAGWVRVAQMDSPHPMEALVLNFDQYTPASLCKTFEMAIPLSQANNIERYIRSNLISYAKVLTRGGIEPIPLDVMVFMSRSDRMEYLQQLTDNEIFNTMGVYVPYNSRVELINNIVQSIGGTRFMMPAVRSKTRSHNAETLMGTEITDATVFMVCFGTAIKYHTYELDELFHAFSRDTNTGVMKFCRPDNIHNTFSTSDIEGLLDLLRCFAPTPDITRVVNLIEEGLIDAREKIATDDEKINQLATIDPTNRGLIRDYLRLIFYTGMYMRRWGGPGEPFPLLSDTTKLRPEPDEKVTHELGVGLEQLKQMSTQARDYCLSLKICEYRKDGGIDHGNANFSYVWNAVVTGKECIRMGSTKFIGTGFHYLRVLFHETIPGMNVKQLDRIM